MAVVIVRNTGSVEGVEVTSQALDREGQPQTERTVVVPRNAEEIFSVTPTQQIVSIKDKS